MAQMILKMKRSPVGLYFHSFHPTGERKWQGQVLRLLDGNRYEVQLYSWLTGHPTNTEIVEPEDIENFLFYESYAVWLYTGDHKTEVDYYP